MQIEPRVASRPLLAVPPARLGEVPELARLLLGGTSGDVDVLLHAVVGDAVVRVRSGLDTAGSVVGVVAVDVAVVAGDFVVLLLVAGVGLLELEIARGSRDGQGAVNGLDKEDIVLDWLERQRKIAAEARHDGRTSSHWLGVPSPAHEDFDVLVTRMGDTCAGSGGIDEEKRGKHDEGGRKTHDDGWDEGGGGGGLEDVAYV